MHPLTSESSSIRWAPALLLTLALHLGAGWGLRYLDLFGATPEIPLEPDLVEVVFESPPEEALPQTFTELPPDRADVPPDRADLLSNVDSRARDRAPDGQDDLARQDGRAEFPQVRMDQGRPSPFSPEPAPAPVESRVEPDATMEESEATPEERTAETAEEANDSDASGDSEPDPVKDAHPVEDSELTSVVRPQQRSQITNDPADPWAAVRRPATPSPPEPPSPRSTPSTPSVGGSSDIRQEAMASLSTNAEFPGDISLNTKAWEWAPWLLAFRRELMESWTAPLGYHLGLIYGWTLLEVVIAPDGTVLSNRLLDEEGNVAFRESSLSAIERSKPYLPLPEDFPEETLILTIRMAYPEWYQAPTQPPRRAGAR